MKKKKSKVPFVVAGGIVVTAALVMTLVFTNVFGLLNKGGKMIGIPLDGENVTTLKVGEICYFIEDEKQSIPYRWQYYISDESLMGLDGNEYEDDSGFNPLPGGDKGWRIFYFAALAPGECVITMRYEDIRDAEEYSDELIYNVMITDETDQSDP